MNDTADKLIALEEVYRRELHATDYSDDFEEMRGYGLKADEAEAEIAKIWEADPVSRTALEMLYRRACNGTLPTKSKWPKRGANPKSPTSDDLISFAYEENLTLTGAPYEGAFPSPVITDWDEFWRKAFIRKRDRWRDD